MMRSLYTAASGMIAQQTNVDVISNNLANVNSTGYKSSTAEFKSLLYQTLQTRSTSANGDYKPIGAQVGTGTRTASITTHFSQGALNESANPFAFAIEGNGLFALRDISGEILYTRNGNFQMAVSEEGFMLCTQEGYPVLDSELQPISFDSSFDVSKISVTSEGIMTYTDNTGNPQSLDVRIGLFQFTNPSGLDSVGNTMFKETAASGVATEEFDNDDIKRSKMHQGYVEASNVQVADEMVNLIIAQRAYELNSKAIQTTDTMMEQANQLKR